MQSQKLLQNKKIVVFLIAPRVHILRSYMYIMVAFNVVFLSKISHRFTKKIKVNDILLYLETGQNAETHKLDPNISLLNLSRWSSSTGD